MKTRVMSMAVGIVTGSLALGAAAGAQSLSPNQFAVDGAIGFAVPVGDYGTGLSTGLDLMGALEYRPQQTWPFSFRGEVGWSHFGVDGPVSANSDITRFVVDALYDFSIPHSAIQPYALAGIGIYHVSVSVDEQCTDPDGDTVVCGTGSNSSTGFGINLGGGLRYQIGRAAQAYFEARYHLPLTGPGALSDSPFLPFQFGVRYMLR